MTKTYQWFNDDADQHAIPCGGHRDEPPCHNGNTDEGVSPAKPAKADLTMSPLVELRPLWRTRTDEFTHTTARRDQL